MSHTPLQTVATKGYMEIVELLVINAKVNVNQSDRVSINNSMHYLCVIFALFCYDALYYLCVLNVLSEWVDGPPLCVS